MCSINHDKKAIFIHIPKNGGSYIAETLNKYYGFQNYYLQRPDHEIFCLGKDKSVDKHENKIHGTLMYYKTSDYLNEVMGMNKENWDTYFIFTFIRNPYDRLVSGWNYCNKYNIPFKNYIHINMNANSYDYWHVFMPQTRHIIDINGKTKINFMGKIETIEEDLKKILFKIGFTKIIHIPFKKNSKKHDDYITYYNNEILEYVNLLLNEDIINLDYEKINNI